MFDCLYAAKKNDMEISESTVVCITDLAFKYTGKFVATLAGFFRLILCVSMIGVFLVSVLLCQCLSLCKVKPCDMIYLINLV